VNAEQALLRLGASTSEAVQGVLQMFSPDGVAPGSVRVVPPDQSPFGDATFPAIAADVSYVDGVTGGNVMVIGLEGARRLAAAMMGMDPMSVEAGGELSELEFSAVGEAMNQMMSAAAMATSKVLDAFIVRMTRALDEMTESHDDAPLGDALRDISVRVWAELGRMRMPSGRIVALPAGAVVELDRAVEAPIDLYADGMRFASGRLMITDDGSLAVRIESVLGASPSSSTPSPDPTPTEVAV
jgi:flagellar motor switch protein FliN/FliY